MHSINTFLIHLLFLSFLFTACQETTETEEVAAAVSTTMEEVNNNEKLLRHVVLFKFKDEADPKEVEKVNQAFNALPDAIPVIQDFEWGINDSPEDFHQGFTHCYLITFASEEDRDSIYTPHPAHQAFVAGLQPHLEKVFVVDYWTNP
jgi:hypothetical protein